MKNKKKIAAMVLGTALLAVVLTGCVPGDGTNSPDSLAGFFSGVWHGWIAPFSLVYSFFKSGINIYEVHNNGIPYNIGYYIAIISGFGSLALSRKKGHGNSGE